MTILRSPAASMSLAENLIKLIDQMSNPGAVYQRGPLKGQLKVKKTMIDLLPYAKQFYKARDIKEQLNWWR